MPLDDTRRAVPPEWVKPGDHVYDTPLDPMDEARFRYWLRKNEVPFDPQAGVTDYDMRGYWKGLQTGDPNARPTQIDPNDQRPHYPDYYKTPTHEKFSNQSQWATPLAPHWEGEGKDERLVPSDPLPEPRRVEAGIAGAPVPGNVKDYMRHAPAFDEGDTIGPELNFDGGIPPEDQNDQAAGAPNVKREFERMAEGGTAEGAGESAAPPPGFTLDQPTPPPGFKLDAPAPPAGFTLDQPAPQYTREKPYLPTSQTDAEQFFKTAPQGSIAKHPKTGEMFEVPPPSAEPAVTPEQEEIDLGGAGGRPLPKPPGIFGTAIEAGKKGIVSGFTEAAQAPTAFRERPPEAPDTSPVGELLRQPISEGWADPKWWVAHIVHGAAASSPSLATGAAGAFAGSLAGPAGALAGGAGGFALGSAMQTIAPAYQKARADGLDHDAAVTRAIETSGIAAVFGGAMGVAPIFAPLKGAVSNALLQIFAAQPALGLGQMAATGAVDGKMPTLDELGTAYAEQAGMGAALVGGHAGARRLMGQPAHPPGPTEAPPAVPGAPAGPAQGAPPVGSVIGMDLGRGPEPATVTAHTPEGDVVLTDADGTTHRMTAADVARFGTEPPAPPAEPAAPAPAQRTTVDVNGERVIDTQGAVPTAEDIRRSQQRTQDDLDRESAEQRAAEARAALTGQGPPVPDPIAAALAADEAEMARPQIPRGIQPESPAPEAPPPAAPQPPAQPAIDLGGMGRGMTDNLYAGLFGALQAGTDTFAGVRDPAIARAKPFFDAGLIKTPQDLQALVQAGYDPVRAGLMPPPAPPVIESGTPVPTPETAPPAPTVSEMTPRQREEFGIVPESGWMADPGVLAAEEARLPPGYRILVEGEHENSGYELIGPNGESIAGASDPTGFADEAIEHASAPPVGGAPAMPPVASPVAGEPEPQAPRPAGTRLELTPTDDERLARLAALEAENTAPETGGFVRRLEAEQAAGRAALPRDLTVYRTAWEPQGTAVPKDRPAYVSLSDDLEAVGEYGQHTRSFKVSDPNLLDMNSPAAMRLLADEASRENINPADPEDVADFLYAKFAFPSQSSIIERAKAAGYEGLYATRPTGHGEALFFDPARVREDEGAPTTTDIEQAVDAFVRGEGPLPEYPREPATTPPEPARPANTPTVTDEVHTKTKKPIFAVRFPEKPDIPDLGGNARRMGGYWSSYRGGGARPGWMFKTREAADRFAAWATEKLGPAVEAPVAGTEQPRMQTQQIRQGAARGQFRTQIMDGPGRGIVGLGPTAEASVAEARRQMAERSGTPEIPRGTEPQNWVPTGTNPEAPEHPGLVVQSLETGRRDVIQPPGTRPPSEWREVGKNADGQTLYEDQRGVRSIVENGIRKTEPVGMRPTRGGMEVTTDRANNPEYEVAPTAGPARSAQEIGREVVKAREDTNDDPTDAQVASGTYKKGRVDFHGISFVMETPSGALRKGPPGPDGEPLWTAEMPPDVDYGYAAHTRGMDDEGIPHKPEGVDVYLGPELGSQKAWIIDQVHADTGAPDEHKIMLAFNDWPNARQAYIDSFSDGRGAERIGNVTPMSLDELKTWLKEGDTKNPIGQQALPLSEPARAPAEHPPHGGLPQVQLADWVARQLEKKTAPGVAAFSSRELQEMAESIYGVKLSTGKFTRAELYDAMELGVNRFIRAHPDEFSPNVNLREAQATARDLEELKDRLPTQTVRAGEKESMQQFSTPPDYAYAVARIANIRPEDHVMEPSAGTGSIAVHALNAGPREATVNELSANRAPLIESFGPTHAYRENAEQLHNILPADIRPTVVVMNPPFSQTAGRMGNKMVAMTGAKHIEQALSRLEPGGRLVAIVGRGMKAYTGAESSGVRFGEGTGATFRDWWRRIGAQYDVRANVGVSGDVYKKYGTTFGTQLLVIDKVPPTGREPVLGEATDIPGLLYRLEGVRNDRPEEIQDARPEQLAAQPGGIPPAPGGEGATRPGEPVPSPASGTGVRTGPTDTGARPEVPGGPRIGGEPTVEPRPEPGAGNALAPEQPERGRPSGTERQPEEGTGERGGLAGGSAEPDAMVLRPEGEPGSVLPVSPDAVGPAPEVVRVDEAAANPETAGPITENVYEPYSPQRITIKGAQEHPTPLVQTAAMASVMPPEVNYTPKLPQNLITEGKLSAAQLEAIIYAGHAHSQMLPPMIGHNGGPPIEYRRGYFIGDGTGVGKGAQVAGIILDNWLQGRKKALWLSESRTLINDAQRDWRWLGRDPKNELFDVGKTTKAGGDIKGAQGIGFLTYDTLKMAERLGKDEEGKTLKGKSRVDQIVNWLGDDFDGVIVFDESHNLANAVQTRGSRGVKDAAQKALAGIELQQKLPNARVVYASATGATEVMNLAYAERLGLWGPGTAFPNKTEFIGQIGQGGVAAMELVARDMKAMGLYISRNLSYDGVEYDRVDHPLSPDQKRIYNDLAEGWQTVLRNIEEALIKTTGTQDAQGTPIADRRQRTDALSAFWSGHQRFFNQIITSMQMPSVIKGIEADLKEGRQAVLQLVNTNEASQSRAISRARAEESDLEDLDMTPRDQLMQLIEKSFPTAQKEEYVDENGNVQTRIVTDAAGNIVHNPEAVQMKQALLEKLGSIRVPDGPLEMLINHFGPDEVAEITGRKQRVVRRPDENGEMRAAIEQRPGSANVTEAEAFQNAKKRILVFSQAGMTGRSYHADLASPSSDARRSHYLVQAGWRADKAIQGFGRTHRTNQESAPIFHLVTTDLQGQRRFISSIARRLAQLGALTKGERRAGESGMFSARDNLESPEAGAALGALWRDIQGARIPAIEPRDFEQQTGLKLRDSAGNSTDAPEITQFLNRLLSLKFDMQNQVFGEFESRLNTAIDRAAASGTLDVGTETLRADRINKEDDRVVHTDPQSGAETRYVRLKVENKSDPRKFDDIEAGRHYLGPDVSRPEFYVRSKRTGKIMAVTPSHDVTDTRDGRVVPQYRLTDPLRYTFNDRDKIEGYGADRYWEKIEDRAQAKDLWDQQVAALPEYDTTTEHLITGAILPIWDRLKGWPTVYRLQTDAGEKMLGRTVHENEIDATLRRLGAEDTGRQYSPQEVADQIMAGGRATLANGWTLSRASVGYEPRIELTGPDYTHNGELDNAGVFRETIGYRTRYFIPTGEDAARVLEQVMQRRPAIEVVRGREGLAEEPSPAMIRAARSVLAGGERDLRDDYVQFRGDADPHISARDWTLQRGQETGFEHLVVHAGDETHASTAGLPDAVAFSPELIARLGQEDAGAVVHHNHPGGNSLSGKDIQQLALPGLDTIITHTGEDTFVARLSPEAKMWALSNPDQAGGVLGTLYRDAAAPIVKKRLQGLVDQSKITDEQARSLYVDIINRALDAAGVLDYVSSRSTDPLPQFWAKGLVREAATQVRKVADAYGIPPSDEGLDARVYRSTDTVRPEESLARLSGDAGEAAAGRPGRAAGDGRGEEGTGQRPGLAEERPDFTDEATRATEDEARAAIPRGNSWSEKAARILGVGPRSPGVGDHFFNIVNKSFTAPRTKASLDPRSNAKWQAELAKYRDAATLLHGYREGLDSWQGKPVEQWRKLFSAMEVLTLEGREVPTDGRAIIVENRDRPYAALSNVGDVIRLTSPEEIQMFADYRGTMDRVWRDLVTETGRQFGWEGTPTSAAIRAAAEASSDRREAGRLMRAAKIVAAIEYQHRTAYLPLMRSGDYFLRVKPNRPNSEWTGEGYPPTVMFKLIDSLSPAERAVGGMRSGTPRLANDAIAELRQTFPEGEYDIDHGHMFRSADAVRDLDIPAIDKLMVLVGNDARGQISERLQASGMERDRAKQAAQADYDKLVDAVLDQIYEQRVAGFKRTRQGIAGYDDDFAKSTGKYLGWLSNYVSGMKHRADIEGADQGIEQHPDPRTRQFWRDWDRRQEDYGDQMYGPLAKMRQGAFLWYLGMNAATTAKIMLHGPLRGVPVLTTGLGAQGRARAVGEYLNASRQLMGALGVGKAGINVDFDKIAGNLAPAERALLADSEAKGILHPQTADELAAVQRQGEEALSDRGRFTQRVFDIWSSNVSSADRMVRGAMLLSAYRTASREGMAAINRVWDKDLNWRNAPEKTPERFAQFMIDQTVGIWGDINRLPALRSQLGGMIGQFKTYEIGYLQNLHSMMWHMGPEGKVSAALMLGGLGMMGGLLALPFAQDIEGAVSTVYRLAGGIDLETDLKHAFDALLGEGGGSAALHGGRPGGIDWSGIGFGDIVSKSARSLLDVAGAAPSAALGNPYRAYERYRSGQGELAAAREMLPNAVKHLVDALYPEVSLTSTSGASKALPESAISDADRAKMALGFQPSVKAEHFEKVGETRRQAAGYRAALGLAEDRIANLVGRGETAEAKQALADALQLVARGERAGVYSAQEANIFRRDLTRKVGQRLHPEIPGKTQTRIEAAQRAQP